MAGAGSTTNSDKTQSSSSSNNKLYKGVRLRKWGKWVSEIRLPNSRERIWLGSYDSPEKAARAFDAALYCLRGRHASFNFPDTPFNVPAPPPHHSLTPQEIQEIAANFANKLDPPPPQPPLVNTNNNNNNQEPPSSRFGSNTATSSSSSTRYELCDQGTTQMQVDNNNGDGMNIDWTFLNVLDESSTDNLGSDNNNNNYYGLYSELEKMHSDEFLYSTPPPPLFEYNNEDEIEAADQSFLWNWNF